MTTRENEFSLFYYQHQAHLGVSTLSPYAEPFIPRAQRAAAWIRTAADAELIDVADLILTGLEEGDLYT